jgi:hypothetical protein
MLKLASLLKEPPDRVVLEFEILKEAAGQGGTLNSSTFTSFHRPLGLTK